MKLEEMMLAQELGRKSEIEVWEDESVRRRRRTRMRSLKKKAVNASTKIAHGLRKKRGERIADCMFAAIAVEDVRDEKEEEVVNVFRRVLDDKDLLPLHLDDYHTMLSVDDLVTDIGNKLKIKDEKPGVKRIMHYCSIDKILLVGEADFSFATCLANAFGNASNLFATSLDSYSEVIERYANAERNIQVLKEKGCVVLHKVDAYTMSEHAFLGQHYFDVIVFNFPHAHLWYREHDPSQIQLHRELVRGFLENAHMLVRYMGEIHITHKTAHPFDRWNIKKLAKKQGLRIAEEAEFNEWFYPGYCNKRGEGHGIRCDESFPVGACSTFIFRSYWPTE